jgi:hypothetical protein
MYLNRQTEKIEGIKPKLSTSTKQQEKEGTRDKTFQLFFFPPIWLGLRRMSWGSNRTNNSVSPPTTLT